LDPDLLADGHPLGLQLSETRLDVLLDRLSGDGLQASSPDSPFVPRIPGDNHVAWMLDIRLLFSALVDADFLDTEAHFEGDATGKCYRPAGLALEPERGLLALERYLGGIRKGSQAEQRVAQLREDLWRACVAAAEEPPGLCTLSAPTGSGKTLAMLAFALRHAARNKLRRVVVVIPYLTIIEQTVAEYRNAFRDDFPDAYVLEHHSLAHGGSDGDKAEGVRYWERLLAENWDAPVVVTTSVQFLESLFSNRPSACRKLHRLAESVILFDEVQTLPLPLAVPTLAALSHLSSRCRSTVVFATATQPAFDHLDREVRQWVGPGWQPREIAAPDLGLFRRLRRVEVRWPDPQVPTSWDDLCRELCDRDQVLVVVNLKRQACDLARRLRKEWGDGLFHLSTAMCPAHRQAVLAEVRRRLEAEERCLLVSTQCVEAGVDVDFPAVYRAFGPLEGIAQAAGRCNREGRRATGDVVVFLPEEEIYPDTSYRRAAFVARSLLIELGPAGMDIRDPALYRRYYERLYSLASPSELRRELQEAIRSFDFPEVDRRYRIVPQDSISILVPYGKMIQEYDALKAAVHAKGLSAGWMRRAQPLTVSLFRPNQEDLIWQGLAALPLKRGGVSDQWFVYLCREDYDPLTGLVSPKAPPIWLV
jgi:CRISPR-associated helicase Cas3